MSCNNTSKISNTALTCLTNIELVTSICKFLNYEQQLQLLQVSRELQYIITNFVWNNKFKEVKVYAFQKTTFLVSDKIAAEACSDSRYMQMLNLREIFEQKNLIFQSNEMQLFFNLNFRNIKKLHLKCNANPSRGIEEFPLTQKLTNLTYLRCEGMKLTHRDLKEVAKNCLKLESLIFFHCFNQKGLPFLLDQDLDIQLIKNMQNLKNLIITSTGCSNDDHFHNFSNIKHILNQFKLQRLNLSDAIEPENYAPENNLTYDNLKFYKDFEIGPWKKFEDFLNYQTNILPKFENLSNLTLKGYGRNITITNEFFDILLKSCTNLTHLSLNDCRIEDFIALPKLQELQFQTCYGLTWLNLKTILHEMHLKCFKSYSTYYTGNLEYFLISATLEKFQCNFTSEKFIELFNFNKKNLKSLLHIDFGDWCWDWSFSLANFAPNLKVLYIRWRYLNISDCFELKCLQEICLALYSNIDMIEMYELLQLLKHDNLRELTLEKIFEPKLAVDFSQFKAFETKLLHLTVCRAALYALEDFCLDLLQINGKLSLTCFGINCDLISQILSNEKFPSRFTCINICGFSIDCASIRNQCMETMDLIKLLVDVFKYPPLKCYFTLG